MKPGDLRQKVWDVYGFIQEKLYLNRPDMEIKERKLNSTLLMSILTGLCQGKELIVGEPGLGKTTSAEYVCALLYQFPLGTIWGSEVSGHPEQTEEKIIGRPDLGKLNLGEEVVVWSHFALLPIKIVDEINRLPETKQSMILDGVDRGHWRYLNDAIINRDYCLFATANFQDRGTNTIIAPMIDRFDIIVESKHPGANLAYLVGEKGKHEASLRNEKLEGEFHRTLNERLPYQVRMEKIEALCDRYGEALEKELGVPTLSHENRTAIRTLMAEIHFDSDFKAFLRLVLAELSFCYQFGQKRSHEDCEEGCHFTGYMCNATLNCISNRFPISVRNFSQALAWLMGDEEVNVEHLKVVLPFTLAHRIRWKEKAISKLEKVSRSDSIDIFMAKEAVKEMHRRYVEQAPQLKEALITANRIIEGEKLKPVEGDHPIYWEIRKDLGEEVNCQ